MNVSSEATLADANDASDAYGLGHRFSFQRSVLAGTRFVMAIPVVLRFRANWHLRTVLLRGLGVGMVLSASGLWLVSGGDLDPELNLIKVGVSVLLFVLGVILVTLKTPRTQPEACFDPVRRELRILHRDSHGRPKVVLRRCYDSIGGARLTNGYVQLFENDGSLLLEVPLGCAVAGRQLRDQLNGDL